MRTATIAELQELVNDPLILPAYDLEEGQTWDLSEVYDNPKNIAFITDAGAMLFGYEKPGQYECHFMFRTTYPGSVIKRDAKAMLQEMFTKYGAHVIKGYPPRGNRAVRVMGVALGFKKIIGADFMDDLGRHCETYEIRSG